MKGKLVAWRPLQIKLLFLGFVLGAMPLSVIAHPGNVDQSGGHTCSTNCAKYGLDNGQYHFHRTARSADSSRLNGSNTEPRATYVAGPASVIDGDTLEIRGQRIRLHGIDAPESSQICARGAERWRCGSAAANRLDDLIAGATVNCEQTGMDRYRRMLAVCSVRGTELNQWLVENGLAFAYRRYSTDYVSFEERARNARNGLWAWDFQYPWDYRNR